MSEGVSWLPLDCPEEKTWPKKPLKMETSWETEAVLASREQGWKAPMDSGGKEGAQEKGQMKSELCEGMPRRAATALGGELQCLRGGYRRW